MTSCARCGANCRIHTNVVGAHACACPPSLPVPSLPDHARGRVEARAAELALEGDSLGRGLKSAAAAREKALVEHDVLKLQVGPAGLWEMGWLRYGGGEWGFGPEPTGVGSLGDEGLRTGLCSEHGCIRTQVAAAGEHFSDDGTTACASWCCKHA